MGLELSFGLGSSDRVYRDSGFRIWFLMYIYEVHYIEDLGFRVLDSTGFYIFNGEVCSVLWWAFL